MNEVVCRCCHRLLLRCAQTIWSRSLYDSLPNFRQMPFHKLLDGDMMVVGSLCGAAPPSERNKTGHLSSCRPAATGLLNLAQHAARGSQRAEGVGQIIARGHVEHHEPAAQSGVSRPPSSVRPHIPQTSPGRISNMAVVSRLRGLSGCAARSLKPRALFAKRPRQSEDQ
jgi:hypothetical protein